MNFILLLKHSLTSDCLITYSVYVMINMSDCLKVCKMNYLEFLYYKLVNFKYNVSQNIKVFYLKSLFSL